MSYLLLTLGNFFKLKHATITILNTLKIFRLNILFNNFWPRGKGYPCITTCTTSCHKSIYLSNEFAINDFTYSRIKSLFYYFVLRRLFADRGDPPHRLLIFDNRHAMQFHVVQNNKKKTANRVSNARFYFHYRPYFAGLFLNISFLGGSYTICCPFSWWPRKYYYCSGPTKENTPGRRTTTNSNTKFRYRFLSRAEVCDECVCRTQSNRNCWSEIFFGFAKNKKIINGYY